MSCVVCGKKMLYRFEDIEDTPQRDFIEENWARCRDWSVCKEHEKPLADLLKRMINLGVNPEVNPKLEEFVTIGDRPYKEWLAAQGASVEFSKYDSDYVGFSLPKEAADMRRKAIDEIDHLPKKVQKLGRLIIKSIDGTLAEDFMAGTVTPNSWTVVSAYEIAFCIISDLQYEL